MFLHLSVILSTGGGWLPSMHHRSHDRHSGGRLVSSMHHRSYDRGVLHPGEGVCIQGEGFASRGGSASRREGVCIWGIRGVCIQERSLHPGRGVCIQGEGSASRGGSASRRQQLLHWGDKGVCIQGKGSAARGRCWVDPSELGKLAVRILLECFLVLCKS